MRGRSQPNEVQVPAQVVERTPAAKTSSKPRMGPDLGVDSTVSGKIRYSKLVVAMVVAGWRAAAPPLVAASGLVASCPTVGRSIWKTLAAPKEEEALPRQMPQPLEEAVVVAEVVLMGVQRTMETAMASHLQVQ